MLHLGMRKSQKWHVRVDGTVRRGGQLLLESEIPSPTFPWAELRLHTDIYLKKKGKLSKDERDRQLLSLVQKYEVPYIAVAACAHRISVGALRDFLSRELQNAQGAKIRETLQAIITAHYINSSTFTESDSQVAQALAQIFAITSNSTSQRLEVLVNLMTSRIPSYSFHHPYIYSTVQAYAAKLSSEIKALKSTYSWLEAHRQTEWLSTLPFQPFGEEAEAIAILSEQFPDWRLWTEWSHLDNELAQTLQACRQLDSDTYKLERVVKAQLAGTLKNDFLRRDVNRQTKVFCSKTALRVETLMNAKQWLLAHKETQWLSILVESFTWPSPAVTKLLELLNTDFPLWKKWAQWSDSDTRLAQTLEACQHSESASCTLERIIKFHIVTVPQEESLMYSVAYNHLRTFSTELSRDVQNLTDSQQWLAAHKETQWLSILVDPSLKQHDAVSRVVEVLNGYFPAWKAWAKWSNADTQLAQTLKACQQHGSTSNKVEKLVNVQIIEAPQRNHLLSLEACNQLKAFSTQLSLEVQDLVSSHQWLAAHEETKWLSILVDPSRPSNQSPHAVSFVKTSLGTHFPDWKAWAEWGNYDSQLAQALAPCFVNGKGKSSRNLRVVMDLFISGIPDQSLLRSPALELARILSIEVAHMLDTLQREGKWHKVRKESQWLSMLLIEYYEPCSGWIEALHKMQQVFPNWRAWAVWSPDLHRLLRQKKLTPENRAVMYDALVLEGPDFLHNDKATLREALIVNSSFCLLPAEVSWGNKARLKVQNRAIGGDRSMYERLSNAVDAACTTGAHNIDLLVYLCCSGSTIDDDTLTILEATSLIASSNVSADVLLVLQPQFEENGRTSQRGALMRLLSILDNPFGQPLRHILSPRLVRLVSNSIREMQGELSIQPENLSSLSSLYNFGKGVQKSQWILPLLDDTLGTLISRWPTAGEMHTSLAIQHSLESRSRGRRHPLMPKLDAYSTECLIEPNTIDPGTKVLIEALIRLFQQSPDYDRTTLAYSIAQDDKLGIPLRCDCLKQLPTVPNGFIKDLIQLLDMTTASRTWIDMLYTLTALESSDHDRTACWRSVLYVRIKDPESKWLDHALSKLTAERWFQWLSDLQTLFAEQIMENPQGCPDFLKSDLHVWIHRIYRFRGTILRLESDIGPGPPIKSLLVGYRSGCSENIIQILELLESYYQGSDDNGDLRPEVRATIALLDTAESGNADEIRVALSSLKDMSAECSDIYLRVLEAYHLESKNVAQVLLFIWLKYPGLDTKDESALVSLAVVLGIGLEDNQYPISKALGAAGHYVTRQVNSLLAEAEKLAQLKNSLQAKDPEGLSALLAELEIEDTSPLEEEIANLLPELVDVVEMVAEDIVELHFPLNHLTQLQKTGIGTPNCGSLIVRLVVGNSSLLSGFCIHFENQMDDFADSCGHSPWLVLDDIKDGGTSSCHGQVNRATFQLGHVLSRHLLGGPKTLEETYKLLKESLDTLWSNCIICGASIGMQLRRSGVCQSASCATAFLAQTNLNVHLDGLREDAEVGDLLITAAKTAAASGNAALLPGCPIELAQVTQLLSNLPPVKSLLHVKDMDVTSRLGGKQSVDFLKWIFAQYGGYLVSASGNMRVPQMPGVIQFLLANAAPNLEKAFAAQMAGQPTKVVFHGTSFDRLYSILCKGLLNCSGNSTLQRHGASYGHGIYVADEPLTSMSYALTNTAPYTGNASHSSTLNVGVLLACEASWNIPTNSSPGIHVIPSPDMLLLRYIFLVPIGVNVPQARHIVPAITSVFNSLRSGSL